MPMQPLPRSACQIKAAVVHWKKQGQPLKNVAGLNRQFVIACTSIASSTIATLFTAPLNTIKVHALDGSLGELQKERNILARLYRGYWTLILKFAPRHAIEHTIYDTLKLLGSSPSIAGPVATSMSISMLHPFDNFHIRRVLQKQVEQGCMSWATRHFGGIAPALLGSTLSGYVWYNCMHALSLAGPIFSQNQFLTCGICALVTNLAVYPFDFIKQTCASHNVNARTAVQLAVRSPQRVLQGLPYVLLTSVPNQTIAYGTFKCFTLFMPCG